MAEEIDFENGHFRNFDKSVTLTLTLDDLGTYINRFVSLSPIHTYIVYMGPLSFILDGRTHVRTDTGPVVWGQLVGADLKIHNHSVQSN